MRFARLLTGMMLTGALTVVGVGLVAPAQAQAKAATGTVYVTTVQDYEMTQDVLKYINKQRTSRGLSAVKLDKSLTKSAMTRAVETVIHIPTNSKHYRPNGKVSRTINSRFCYEICVQGWGLSAKEYVSAWMASSMHRAGILLKNAKSVGIGCVQVGEVTYLVGDFSATKAKSVLKRDDDEVRVTKKITSLTKYLKSKCFSLKGENDLEVGEHERFSLMYKGTTKYNKQMQRVPIAAKSATWKSSNPAVAKVSSKGVVTAVAPGKTKITAKLKNGTKASKSKTVCVEED